MKLRRTYPELRDAIKTVLCLIAAAVILLISIPSYAAEEAGAEAVPDTETVITADEDTEETGEDGEESETESIQTGYVTMRAVSGNTSITN